MSELSDNLQRLVNARTAIASAITAKGGTVSSGDGLEDFPADIGTISDPSYVYLTGTNAASTYIVAGAGNSKSVYIYGQAVGTGSSGLSFTIPSGTGFDESKIGSFTSGAFVKLGSSKSAGQITSGSFNSSLHKISLSLDSSLSSSKYALIVAEFQKS